MASLFAMLTGATLNLYTIRAKAARSWGKGDAASTLSLRYSLIVQVNVPG